MRVLFYLLSFWSVGIALLCAFYVSGTLREKQASAQLRRGRAPGAVAASDGVATRD